MRFSPAYLSLVIVVSYGAGATAQSGSNSNVPTSPTTYQAPHDSRDQLPLVGRSKDAAGKSMQMAALLTQTPGKITILAPPTNHVCYAIRSYNYVQDGASADAVRLKDSTNCEPAANGRMKAANVPR